MSFPRYLEYKDSGVTWLGDVPGHWDVAKTVRFFKVAMGQTILKEDLIDEGEWPVFSATDGDHYFGRVNNPQVRLAVGDVVIPARGNSIGAVKIVKEPATTTQTTIYCKNLSAGRLEPQFVFHYLTGCKDNLFYFTQTAIPQITVGEVGSNPILIPPLPEQTAIATFLDRETAKIDALVAEQEKLIALLQEKRQAVISHAVTKGLDPNVPMKDSGVEWLGEVPGHWGVSPLKFLARVGNGSTPNRDNPHYWAEDGFPWLNSSVVNQSEVSEAERFVTPTALKECHLPIIEPPAVLVGITGQGKTRGMAAPLTFTATVNQHVAYIKPDRDCLGVDFLLRVLEAAYLHLRTESEGVGSTKGAITCEQLGAWRMPIPGLREQSEIVCFLDAETTKIDTLTAEARTAITLLQERRTALISAAVTGQIDVRGMFSKEVNA